MDFNDEEHKAMMNAVHEGDLNVIRNFLGAGKNVNFKKNSWNETFLLEAIRRGHEDVIHCLLDHGADVNLHGRYEYPLEACIRNYHEGMENVFKRILKKGLDHDHLNDMLHVISRHGYLNLFKLLLAAGADITYSDFYGKSSLLCATENGHLDMVKFILSTGEVDINYCDEDEQSCLFLALRKNQFHVAKFLIESGIDINYHSKRTSVVCSHVRDNFCSGSALILLCTKDHFNEELIDIIISMPERDINLQSKNGNTALLTAIEFGHVEIAKLLLVQEDCDINLQNNHGTTPLMNAAYYGHKDIVELLLDREDCDLNLKDEDGDTALTYAIEGENQDIVQLFLDTGKFEQEGDEIWYCDKCQEYSIMTEKHCDKCDACVYHKWKHCDKCETCDVERYKHCDICNKCVDPDSFFHCKKCNECTKYCFWDSKSKCCICGNSRKEEDID